MPKPPKALEPKKHLLASSLASAEKAVKTLSRTYEKAKPYLKELKSDELSLDADDVFETLTSRFSRLADILTQKVFRAIDAVELIEEGSILDRFNRAEKRAIIDSADTWAEIRDLRNSIAHDYAEKNLNELRERAFKFIPALLTAFEKSKAYASKLTP